MLGLILLAADTAVGTGQLAVKAGRGVADGAAAGGRMARRQTVAGGEVKVPRRKSVVTGSPPRQGIGNGLGAMMTASNSIISDGSDGSPAPGRMGQSPRVGSRKSVVSNLSFRE